MHDFPDNQNIILSIPNTLLFCFFVSYLGIDRHKYKPCIPNFQSLSLLSMVSNEQIPTNPTYQLNIDNFFLIFNLILDFYVSISLVNINVNFKRGDNIEKTINMI